MKGEATVFQAPPADTTAPTVTFKSGAQFTKQKDDGYKRVSFRLHDEGLIDRIVLNGVPTDLENGESRDLDVLKPGVLGAVLGVNTLQVVDVAGNSTEVTFTLTK